MKKRNFVALSIAALSVLVLGACDTATTSSTVSSVDNTSIVATSETTSEEPVVVTYDITIPSVTGVTITPNVTEAEKGETVTLSVVLDADYQLDSLTLSDGVELTTVVENQTYTFVMPEKAVTVSATVSMIVHSYSVTVTEVEGVTVTSDVATAKKGDTVTLSVALDTDYVLDSFTITGDITPVANEDETEFTFVMPGNEVTVTANVHALVTSAVTFTGDEFVAISGTETAKEGEVVSVKVAYTDGYTLDTLTAVAGTTTLTLTAVSPIEYTFVMPGEAVEVTSVSKAGEVSAISNTKFRESVAMEDFDEDGWPDGYYDYQIEFGVNTLKVTSKDNDGDYTGSIVKTSPFVYDAAAATIVAYTTTKTLNFTVNEDLSSVTLVEDFTSFYPSAGATFDKYIASYDIRENMTFGAKLSGISSSYKVGDTVNFTLGNRDGYVAFGLEIYKYGDSSVTVNFTDNGDNSYTFIMPEFMVEIKADAVEQYDIAGREYSMSSYYYDDLYGEDVNLDMMVSFTDDVNCHFAYTDDNGYDDKDIDTTYVADPINKVISVVVGSKTLNFKFVEEGNVNQLYFASSYAGFTGDTSYKLNDRKFTAIDASDENATITFDSTAAKFENDTRSFTLTFADGYELDTVSAKDADDNDVALTLVDGTYTYTQPYSTVTITVTSKALPVASPVTGKVFTGTVAGYDSDPAAGLGGEPCDYDVTADFISADEVHITAEAADSYYGYYAEPVDSTYSYTYDETTKLITIGSTSSHTATLNDDGSITFNYDLSTYVTTNHDTLAEVVAASPVSGTKYSYTTGDDYGEGWIGYSYTCSFDFTSDTEVKAKVSSNSSDMSEGESITTYSTYTYDAATKTITIDGDATKTLTLNDDGTLTCNYAVGNECDCTGFVFTA